MRQVGLFAVWLLAGCGSVESNKKADAAVADAAVDAPPECPVGVTTFCEGNGLVSCDGAGNVTGTVTCALGCNTTASRCNLVAPSNNLLVLFDEAAASTDLVLSGPTTIDTSAETIIDGTGARTPLTSVVPSGVGWFVIKVKSFTTGGNVSVVGTRALVILSGGDVVIGHDINVSARTGGVNGPGALTTDLTCKGANAPADNVNGDAGGGGGAFGTTGGKGGNGGSPNIIGANGGSISGTGELVPLRGGCPGGRSSDAAGVFAAGGGGGAIQITSGTSITVGDGAAILANGGGGGRVSGPALCGSGPCGQGEGGGAGGGVLLEAPVVTINATAGVFANGGGGSCGNSSGGQAGTRSNTPALGQGCTGDNGDGGDGGAGTIAATNADNGSGTYPVGGGGGGGRGRIRVNLPLGTAFTPAGTLSGVQSAGTLDVR